MIDLTGKNVLITGGSRGIGAACAMLFARSGADVGIVYNSAVSASKEVTRRIERLSRRCVAIRGDVRDYAQCTAAVKIALKSLGSIDILVNSAGIWESASIEKLTESRLKKTMDINLGGTINMVRAVVGIMKTRKTGIIINIASTAGQRGEALHAHYAASKGAVIALTKSLAIELAPDGIRVNSISPGWVDTGMVSRVIRNPRELRSIQKSIPRGMVASPEDIAGPILFLASDLAKHIIGANISVNGGSVLVS